MIVGPKGVREAVGSAIFSAVGRVAVVVVAVERAVPDGLVETHRNIGVGRIHVAVGEESGGRVARGNGGGVRGGRLAPPTAAHRHVVLLLLLVYGEQRHDRRGGVPLVRACGAAVGRLEMGLRGVSVGGRVAVVGVWLL